MRLNGDLKSAILKRFPGCQITTITEVTDDSVEKGVLS